MVRNIKVIKKRVINYFSGKHLKKKLIRQSPPTGKCELKKPIIDGEGEIYGFHCNCFENQNNGHPVIKKISGKNIHYRLDYTQSVRIR